MNKVYEIFFKPSDNKHLTIKKIGTLVILIYVVLTVAFYFLAGEALHFRTSRSNISSLPATSGSVELVAGTIIEQEFTSEVQRVEKINLVWGTYGRLNEGNVTIELINLLDENILASQSISASNMTEGYQSVLIFEPPIENLYQVPVKLRITSQDAVSGSAVSPLMNSSSETNNTFKLVINGIPIQGRLCFSVLGEDYIWTGLHYWKFASIGALLILIYFWIAIIRVKQGKRCLLFIVIYSLQKYAFLIKQLVARDFKTKYKRSVLGVLWSFLNPLLTMIVQYLVFSNLFRFDIPNYSVYLISGIVMFNFFTESCGLTLGSIVGNASLIKKVYVPKYIYPLTRVLSSLINLLISLIPLLVVVLISGMRPTKAYLLLPFELVCLLIFSLGIGMILASSMVFFRDTQFLWGVLSMIWMYMTPLFYPESILPESMSFVLKINPMHYFVKFTRIIIIDGVSPEPLMYVQCALFATASLLIGTWIFKKSQDKFVLYL